GHLAGDDRDGNESAAPDGVRHGGSSLEPCSISRRAATPPAAGRLQRPFSTPRRLLAARKRHVARGPTTRSPRKFWTNLDLDCIESLCPWRNFAMKQHLLSWSAALAASALLLACSSTPLNTPAPVTTATPQPTAPATAPSADTAGAPKRALVPEYLDPNSEISTKRSVYFDYDDFTIKNEYADVIATHGKYLNPQPALHIRIEGNADERGSAEYNLALGQKRAEAVARALKVYGVKDAQVEAVSFG